MGNLSDIVAINISGTAAPLTRPGFGTLLIVDYHTKFAERLRFYASTDAMIVDGFTVNDAAYIAASKALSQRPRVTRVAVGRKALAPDMQVDFTPIATSSTQYRMKLRGPTGLTATALYTSDGSATAAEIIAGLVSAINTAAVGITATDQTTFLRMKASTPGLWFSAFTVNASGLATRLLGETKQTHADPGIATDLAAIKLESNDFYGVESTTASAAEITALASWIESNKKMSAQSTQDTDCPTSGGGIMASTKAASQYRTFVTYNPDPGQFAGAAHLGSVFPKDPGSVTFMFRQLANVTTVPLTETELSWIETHNGSTFTEFGGRSITVFGKTAAGEWADFIRDRDWFEANGQLRIFGVKLANDKVPYTNKGIALEIAEVRALLKEGTDAGFLSEDVEPTVTYPTSTSVNPTDKANRILRPVNFTATAAGAIHATELTGTVTP